MDYIKKYPGVTKIVNHFKDTKWLEAWKAKVGDEVATQKQAQSFELGNLLHNIVDDIFQGYTEAHIENRYKKNIEFEKAQALLENIKYSNYFDKVNKIIERDYYIKSNNFGSFSGRFDFMYENKDGDLVLCDLKTSKKPKKKEWIIDYYTQVAAYAVGYFLQTKIAVKNLEILIVNEENFDIQLFQLSSTEVKDYSILFKDQCIEYNKLFNGYKL